MLWSLPRGTLQLRLNREAIPGLKFYICLNFVACTCGWAGAKVWLEAVCTDFQVPRFLLIVPGPLGLVMLCSLLGLRSLLVLMAPPILKCTCIAVHPTSMLLTPDSPSFRLSPAIHFAQTWICFNLFQNSTSVSFTLISRVVVFSI